MKMSLKKAEVMEYGEDCIHLKACRRISKILKNQLRKVEGGRRCHPALCNAYTPNTDDIYITIGEAVAYARRGASYIESGYGVYDVYCSSDLQGQTLGEIVNETNEQFEIEVDE